MLKHYVIESSNSCPILSHAKPDDKIILAQEQDVSRICLKSLTKKSIFHLGNHSFFGGCFIVLTTFQFPLKKGELFRLRRNLRFIWDNALFTGAKQVSEMNKKPERSKRATPGPVVEERKKYATKKPITEGKISVNVGTSASALKKPSNVSIHTLSSSKEYINQEIAIANSNFIALTSNQANGLAFPVSCHVIFDLKLSGCDNAIVSGRMSIFAGAYINSLSHEILFEVNQATTLTFVKKDELAFAPSCPIKYSSACSFDNGDCLCGKVVVCNTTSNQDA
eukprot:scaffold67753_cov66-Cyclotella_meneghiniana.AAC.1